MLRFSSKFFLLNIIVLIIIFVIAIFVHDQFIRPFFGDVLIVIWIYLFCRSFMSINTYKLAVGVLLFSYGVEIAQYFNLVSLLGLQNIKLARIIIGSTFDWLDLVAYTIGWFVIFLTDKYKIKDLSLMLKLNS